MDLISNITSSEVKKQCSAKFEPAKPTFQLYVFDKEISESKVLYQVLKMKDSTLICINHSDELFLDNLALAMNLPNSKFPTGISLIGDFVDEHCKSLAIKVSKKLNKTTYVSCGISDKMILPLVEKLLYEEIKNKSDCF